MTARRSSHLAALGLSWRDIPTSLRDVAAAPLSEADWAGLTNQGLRGLVEVHTCARSLWLLSADDPAWAGALLQARLVSRLLAEGSNAYPEVKVGDEALRYLFRVSIGLDSFVEGEADVGGQVNDGFQVAALQNRVCSDLQAAWRSVIDLGNEARRAGVVRPGRGMGHLAVDTLLKSGIKPDTKVGVVGAGKIGHQVMASIERAGFTPPAVYNRSPKDGAGPLGDAAAAGHAAYVVCTAAPSPWFMPPATARAVVDLGRPGQVAGPSLDLDALLSGFGLRLSDEARARAEALVHDAVSHWHTRTRLHASQHVLARVQSLRDAFVYERVESLLAPAMEGLDAPTRKRVLHATQTVVRRYSHEVLGALKETVS